MSYIDQTPILIILIFIASPIVPCNVPSTFWCDNPSIAVECKAAAACTAYNTSVYNKKLELTLLYEALCPDCQNFILQTLFPIVYENLASIVDFKFVPYGNARGKYVNGTFQVDCQHGVQECELNMFHACALSVLDRKVHLPFIYCLENATSAGLSMVEAEDRCFKSEHVSQGDHNKIIDCYKGPKGPTLIAQAAKRTNGIGPDKHTFVPWILINGVSTTHMQQLQDTIGTTICLAYRGKHLPSFCDTMSRRTVKSKSYRSW